LFRLPVVVLKAVGRQTVRIQHQHARRIAINDGDIHNSPNEQIEAKFPLVIERYALVPDSGGAGRYRGGHGLEIEIENRSGRAVILQAAFDRIVHPPRGRDGGKDGLPGALALKSSGAALRGKGAQEIPAGERLVVLTPGGGGIGDPAARDRTLVERDLRDETVSVQTIARDYGIALRAAE